MGHDESKRKEEGKGLLDVLGAQKTEIDPAVFKTLKILEAMEPPPKEPNVYISSEGTGDADAR